MGRDFTPDQPWLWLATPRSTPCVQLLSPLELSNMGGRGHVGRYLPIHAYLFAECIGGAGAPPRAGLLPGPLSPIGNGAEAVPPLRVWPAFRSWNSLFSWWFHPRPGRPPLDPVLPVGDRKCDGRHRPASLNLSRCCGRVARASTAREIKAPGSSSAPGYWRISAKAVRTCRHDRGGEHWVDFISVNRPSKSFRPGGIRDDPPCVGVPGRKVAWVDAAGWAETTSGMARPMP
jgi:hypothetical protein